MFLLSLAGGTFFKFVTIRSFGESVNFKDLSKKTRRWCVLKDNFLAYFKNQSDTVPAGIIAVDYHVMKLVEDKNTKQVSLTLERCANVITIIA